MLFLQELLCASKTSIFLTDSESWECFHGWVFAPISVSVGVFQGRMIGCAGGSLSVFRGFGSFSILERQSKSWISLISGFDVEITIILV